MIAVMGAAGNVGSKVANMLLHAGEEVRALEHIRDLTELRERGAHVVAGDALSVDELTAFLDGARAALVLLPEEMADPDFVEKRAAMARAMCDAIRKAGVSHVVALSFVGAARADAPGPPAGLHDFEQYLGALDNVNLLVLRSATYMDYLLAALPMIQAQKVNGSAVDSNVRIPPIATVDVAREAAERLRLRDFTGHETKLLLGPEDVSMPEATRAIGERIGMPDLPYVQFPPDAVRDALLDAGMSEQAAGLLVDMQHALGRAGSTRGRTRFGPPEASCGECLTAACERKVGFEVNVIAEWPPKDQDGDYHTAWIREGWELMEPHASGVYTNFLSDEGADGIEPRTATGLDDCARSRIATIRRISSA